MNLCLFPVDWGKVFGGRFQMVYLLPELVPGLNTNSERTLLQQQQSSSSSFICTKNSLARDTSLWNTVVTWCQTNYVTLEALKVGVLRWAEGKSSQS